MIALISRYNVRAPWSYLRRCMHMRSWMVVIRRFASTHFPIQSCSCDNYRKRFVTPCDTHSIKMSSYFDFHFIADEAHSLLSLPGAPSVAALVVAAMLATGAALLLSAYATMGTAFGNERTFAQLAFGIYVAFGRLRNLLCSPCDRARSRYPVPATCQIPFFKDISDVYTFIWGYKTDGFFVEIGGYDGESFSNTSGLADLGWSGAYVEPIPHFAAACRLRHSSNRDVSVHEVCVGEQDGLEVDISTAGPFSSAVPDEVATVNASSLNGALRMLGWSHSDPSASRVHCTTVSLHTFLKTTLSLEPVEKVTPRSARSGGRRGSASGSGSASGASQVSAAGAAEGSSPHHARSGSQAVGSSSREGGQHFFPAPKLGPIDLLVIDVEGLEWPILKHFPVAAWRPHVVVIEIQELQARYRQNARVQADAAALFDYFREAGYAILYKDVVNTVFVHRDLPIAGGA